MLAKAPVDSDNKNEIAASAFRDPSSPFDGSRARSDIISSENASVIADILFIDS